MISSSSSLSPSHSYYNSIFLFQSNQIKIGEAFFVERAKHSSDNRKKKIKQSPTGATSLILTEVENISQHGQIDTQDQIPSSSLETDHATRFVFNSL